MTVLTRPWRAFLSLFANRTAGANHGKWVEPWNAITLAVLYGDPARFERYETAVVTVAVPNATPFEATGTIATSLATSSEPETRDYFATSSAALPDPRLEEADVTPPVDKDAPREKHRAA